MSDTVGEFSVFLRDGLSNVPLGSCGGRTSFSGEGVFLRAGLSKRPIFPVSLLTSEPLKPVLFNAGFSNVCNTLSLSSVKDPCFSTFVDRKTGFSNIIELSFFFCSSALSLISVLLVLLSFGLSKVCGLVSESIDINTKM